MGDDVAVQTLKSVGGGWQSLRTASPGGREMDDACPPAHHRAQALVMYEEDSL